MSIADQAFSNGANFGMQILLARWLEAEVYGGFVVAFTAFLLMQSLYNSMVAYPISIYGSGKYEKGFRRYLGVVSGMHIIGSALVCVSLITAGHFFLQAGSKSLGESFVAVGFVAPFWLLSWLVRQPFYVISAPHWAALGSFIYMVILLIGLVALGTNDLMSVAGAMALIAVASAVSSAILIFVLRPQWRSGSSEVRAFQVYKDHFSYGRWASFNNAVVWVQGNVGYMVLPYFVGLAGSADLRALMNLVTPIQRLFSSLNAPLVPEFVRRVQQGGKPPLLDMVRKFIFIVLIVGLSYTLMLALFGGYLIHFLYGGRYMEYASFPILFAAGLIPLFTGIYAVVLSALSSMGRIDMAFKTSLVAGVVTLALGIGFTAALGVEGAVLGWLSAGIVSSIVSVAVLKRTEPKDL